MKKILIVENSKLIVSMFQKSLNESLNMQLFVAQSLEETKTHLQNNTFFMVVTNLNLSDAAPNEHIELLATHNIPTIIFSSQVESALPILKKYNNIIDYVFKDANGVKYIVRLIEAIEYAMHKKILLVEDSETSQAIVKTILGKLFLTVITANNGMEALEILKHHDDFAAVIVDYQMPIMDGLEFLKLFKSDINHVATPTLITTLNTAEELRIQLYKHGANDIIHKPILEEELKYKFINLFLDAKQNEQNQIKNRLIEEHIITSSANISGNITSASEAFCRICGYTKEELLGKNHRILKHPDMPDALFKNMWSTISSGKIWRGEIKNRAKDGTSYWVDAVIEPLFDNDKKIVGYYAIRIDITDKKRIEELSITDGLTHIFNRRHFNERFPQIIKEGKTSDAFVCFLLMDIDHFKQYNDNYGHQAGDDVLIAFAASLMQSIRQQNGVAFRLGGEEFGILFSAKSASDALTFANTVRLNIENLKIPHAHSSASVYVTASMGLVCHKASDLKNMDEAYKQADELLYQSKESGRNKVSLHD